MPQPIPVSGIRDGAALRAWRFRVTRLGVRSGGQRLLAELLGITQRRLRSWELDEHQIPRLLPNALRGVEHDLHIAANRERRRRAANKRATRRRRSRHLRAVYMAKKRAEERAEWRVIRERGTQLAHLQGLRRSKLFIDLRVMSKIATQLGREYKFSDPDAPILKPLRLHEIKPRKIRSDFGKRHRFRGRPGLPLRPEDIQYGN